MNALSNKIEQLRFEGATPMAIAKALEVNIDKVYAVIRAARRRGVSFPALRQPTVPSMPRASDMPKLCISKPLYALLARRATQDGRSASEMASKLLQDALIGGTDD